MFSTGNNSFDLNLEEVERLGDGELSRRISAADKLPRDELFRIGTGEDDDAIEDARDPELYDLFKLMFL